nr:bacteriophage holin [Bacteroidota bacterium]
MKLNVLAIALAVGITWGVAIFLLTFWFLIFDHQGSILGKLSLVYLGYSITWYGAFIGLAWGFADGFIGGTFFAWLYNKFAKLCKSSEG